MLLVFLHALFDAHTLPFLSLNPHSDLLDEAKERCRAELIERKTDLTPEEIDATAEALGYGAVKYFDLSKNRITNYQFAYDAMCDLKGNTGACLLSGNAQVLIARGCLLVSICTCHLESALASLFHSQIPPLISLLVLFLAPFLPLTLPHCLCLSLPLPFLVAALYMLYAHARICSILRNAGVDMAELRRTGKIELAHPAEVALAMHMLRFPEVRAAATQLLGPIRGVFRCGD
jgi:hypothetical protein